jgi:hypothetical protein
VPQVSTPLLAHWTAAGVQTPVQAPFTQAWLVQVTAALHCPLALHVSTPLPEQWVAPGVHAAHVPPTHTGVPPPHAVAVPQLPVASHVSTPLPEQRVAPGVHTPEQQALAPPSHPPMPHTYVHPLKLPHWPPEVQVWTPLLEHWVAPGVQPEVQEPPVQVFAQGVPVLCQVPSCPQVCGCCPLHCCAPGVQMPVHVAAADPASDDEPVPPLQT